MQAVENQADAKQTQSPLLLVVSKYSTTKKKNTTLNRIQVLYNNSTVHSTYIFAAVTVLGATLEVLLPALLQRGHQLLKGALLLVLHRV